MFIWVRNDTETHKTSENKMAATALILKVFTLFNTIYQLHAVFTLLMLYEKRNTGTETIFMLNQIKNKRNKIKFRSRKEREREREKKSSWFKKGLIEQWWNNMLCDDCGDFTFVYHVKSFTNF